ncbi:MAG: acetyl-CoA carboxylase, biotin carboxyl carrier protein [Nitrospirae bacterium GWC2_42_7]|nr:MAG: acetyl-CoA carboxylase, biotin carboxyl carrier protein [Nitrospirae bacterium GWC2_42_7]
MELEDLKNLIELLKDTDVTELQIEKDGSKVKIRRDKIFSSMEISAQRPLSIQENIIKETEDENQRLITITSPIVGTFYRSASPEAPSFVDHGTKVKKGQVLCIIEAMKLMNEIECETDGIVVKALVENGQPVEYGEPLFRVEPL